MNIYVLIKIILNDIYIYIYIYIYVSCRTKDIWWLNRVEVIRQGELKWSC